MHSSGYSGRCINRQRGRVQILFFLFYSFLFYDLFILLSGGVRSPSSTPLNTPLSPGGPIHSLENRLLLPALIVGLLQYTLLG